MRAAKLGISTSDPRTRLGRRLGQVLRPGRLHTRAGAAAGLPTPLAALLAIVSFVLAVELIGYIFAVAHDFLQVMFARWDTVARIPTGAVPIFLEVAIRQIRPHVIPALLAGPAGWITGLSVAMYLVVLLESMNLVLLAPLAVGCGQTVTRVLRRTRRLLLALGSVWLLEWSAAWVVLFLGISALVLRGIEVMYIRISYTLLNELTTLSLEACLAGLLLAWVNRLIHAAGHLAPLGSDGSLTPRCSACGYLLSGVPEGSACRECGLQDPQRQDRQRTDSPWLHRRRIGRYRAAAATSVAVLTRPGRFFAGLKTLSDVRENLRFWRMNLWLSMAASLLAVPGIAAALIEPDDIYIASKLVSAILTTLAVAFGLTLAGALLIGLLISLLGFAINRAREEAAWPIAVTAGCHLAAVLPRIALVQSLWVTGLFTAEQVTEPGIWMRLSRHLWVRTGLPWEMLLSLIFGAPIVLGLLLLAGMAVVCYRRVRYACR